MTPDIEALCARLEAPWSRVIALVERTYADGKVTTIDPLREEAAAALREQAGEIDGWKVKWASTENALAVRNCEAHDLRIERDALQARVRELEAAALAKDPCSGQYREYDELVAERDALRAENAKLCERMIVDVEHLVVLRAENERLRKDAERWRWSRSHGAWETESWLGASTPEQIDAAVDAAMSAGQYAMTDSIDSPQAPLK